MRGLWERVYKYSKDKVKEAHLIKNGCDIKCPNCNEWFSVSGIEYKHTQESVWFGSSCICGQCNHKSYWNMIAAPVPLLCNESGEF